MSSSENASLSLSPGKRRLAIAIFGAIALLLALGLWLAGRPSEPPLQGEVEVREVNVAAKIAGTAGAPRVEEGDEVAKGELLLTIEAPLVGAAQQQSEALLETAQALQSIAEEGVRPEDIASLRAVAEAADAQAQLARVSARRAETLYADGVIAAQRRDEARAFATSTAANARAANLQYRKAVEGARTQTRRAADAQVALASGGRQATDVLGRDQQIAAPIAGQVARRLVEEGEVIAPAIPLFQIVDLDHPWVRLSVRESRLPGLRRGSVLEGDIPALGLEGVGFRVTKVSALGEFATSRATRQSSGYDERSFELHLEPVEKVDGLRPGMSVLFDPDG
ncbi:HlyD family secretion protein [Sphingomicrobium arenosum]|uniref:HlyD family secretion protein n=1 Tax=Sphingomicrobium arenosum TaxID=2233861 RepID=UPI00223EF428|nr:efflux RND transporter periplasmic adaptor subunit [Sphingomicrobium arenosum]